ncbi:hypothetical protein MTO96_000423 [Rhipicephalus appendiculatus]
MQVPQNSDQVHDRIAAESCENVGRDRTPAGKAGLCHDLGTREGRTGNVVDFFKSEQNCLQYRSERHTASRSRWTTPPERPYRTNDRTRAVSIVRPRSPEKQAVVKKDDGDQRYTGGDVCRVQPAPASRQYIVRNMMDRTQLVPQVHKSSGGGRNTPYGESHVQFEPEQAPVLPSPTQTGERQRRDGCATAGQRGQQRPGWPLNMDSAGGSNLPATRTHEEATTPSITTATMQKIDAIFGNQGAAMPPEAHITAHGIYQWLLLACAYLAAVAVSFQNFSVQLLAPPFDYWCKPPGGSEQHPVEER